MSRRLLLTLALVAVVTLGGYSAYAHGLLAYRDADLRLDATLEPEPGMEASRVWRFEIPPGVRQIEIRKHLVNDGEATLAFGKDEHALMAMTFITPNGWGPSSTSTTAVEPGPYEVHFSAKKPARVLLGIYFHEEPYVPGA